ncbi:MAG: aminotransferase class V-fold PLP-dependent enzyme [Cyclobacteriaceae bacterium]|nr:aminotransferase class V-fold PLP-dependent enzyme [Cyclobacteriaceae bacterium]
MSNKLFFTPGPSQLFYTVPFHLNNAIKSHIGSISHRSGQFQSLYQECTANLRELLALPDGYHILFVGSATEVWERLLQNLVGFSSHHLINGSFSRRFFEFTQDYQFASTKEEIPFGTEFDNLSVPDEAELISITYNETSTGYQFDNNRLKQIRETHPDKLIALDVVSISPAVPIDFSLVDTAYFSVQKCFGLPAGLGVWIVNERCIDKANQLKNNGKIIGSYHSLPLLSSTGAKFQTPETPNVLGIYLLSEVIKDMLKKGVATIQNETKYKAALLYQLFEETEGLTPFIKNKINRSKTVCVAEVMPDNKRLIEEMGNRGMVIGKGYGPYKETHIRIANFPTHSKEQVELLTDQIKSFFAR